MLTWKDFFDFSDDQTVQEGIALIEKLERTYQKMIGAVEDSNQRLAGDLAAVESNAEDLLKTITALNIGMEKNQKVLSESSSASEDLVKEYMALKNVQAENEKQVVALQTQLDKLTEAKQKAAKATEHEAGSIDDLRTRLAEAEKSYKAMGSATDEAVKQQQLDKVEGLAAEYKALNGALAEAKKGATAAAGSYNELSARVSEAKKRLREMEGGLDGNSKEFKELRKFAKEGTDQLKEWDEAVGDNQRKVGDYAGEIGKLSPGFGALISGIDGATTAGKAFIATPIGMILLAIATALGAITAYFKGSIEGQDDFNKVVRVGEAILETFMDVVESVGKVLFEAITKPKETWEKFMTLIKPLGDAIKGAFENPMQALKDFGNAIVNQIMKRVEGMGKAFQAVGKIIRSGFTDGFKDLGNAVIQIGTGVEDAIDKMVKAFEPLTDELQRRIALAQKIAALENRLRKERIADILDDAKTELEVIKLAVEAKDKLRFSDEERFRSLRKLNTLLEDQLKGDLELIRAEIQLQRMLIEQDGETYESRQKLVELQAQEIQLQTKFFQQRKKRQSEEIALIREVEKEMIDSRKRISAANNALETVRLNDAIKTNQKILADENATLEARLGALFQISEAQQELLEDDRDKQLEIAKEAALARVELDSETIDAIYSQESLSLEQRIQLEREHKEKLLENDLAYVTEAQKINEDFNNKTTELLQATTKSAEDNVFKVLARDADRFQKQISTATNQQIDALNSALAAGNISVAEYQRERDQIVTDGLKMQLNGQLTALEEELKLYEGNAQKQIEIAEKIAKVKRELSDMTTDEIIENEIRLNEALSEIKNEAVAFGIEMFNANIQRNIEGYEAEIVAEEEKKNKSLAIAGEDAQAKALIEQQFAEKKKQIDKQIAAEKRKQAVFQKAVDATQVVISTAKGIAAAVAESPLTFGLPWSAFMAVTGALQLGRILAAPIPQFFRGTQHSPEGLALVAERGREIVIDPSGKASLYDKPSVPYLEGGSKVLPNYRTEQILRQADQEELAWQQLISDGYQSATKNIDVMGTHVDVSGIINSVQEMKREMVDAVHNIPRDYYDDRGYRSFERTLAGRVRRLDNRTKLQ